MTPVGFESPALLAAGFDWLEALLPILFVGFWILSQVFAVLRRMAGGPAQPPVIGVPGGPRRDDAVPRPQPDADPRAELEQQIADFLRQVTGEQADAEPQRTRRPPKPQPGKPAPRPRAEQPPRPKPALSTATPQRPAAPMATRDRVGGPADRPVGTLDTGSSSLARHVQDAFAHDLGHLHSDLETFGDESKKAAVAGSTTGGGIQVRDLVTAARDPATIRQAILLREILERPVDRW